MASAWLYVSPPKMGCGSSGPGASALARSKISWLKNGISTSAWALSKSIALCSVPPATGTPTRVAKYARTSLRKSKSSTRNSPSAGAKLKFAASRSITVAPAFSRACTASSNAFSTDCGVGTFGSNPPNPTRVTPSLAPWRAVRVHELAVVRGDVLGTGLARSLPAQRDAARRRIASVEAAALDDAQRRCRIGHRPSMGTDRVLRVRDGHDAGAAGEPDSGLDGGDAVGVGGTDDAAVGLAAERHRGEVRRRRGARAGAGAAGVAIDAVRVVRLPAAARPAADRFEGAEVRPLRQVGLA